MGKIIEYVILLSNLSLIIRAGQYKDAPSNYEREKQGNFTVTIKQFFPENKNEIFNKKIGDSVSPSGFQERRGKASQRLAHMSKTPGLQAFATRDPPLKIRRKQPPGHWKNGVSSLHRSPHSMSSRKNYRYFYPPNWAGRGSIPKDKNPKLPFNNNQSFSPNYKSNEDSVKSSSHQSYGSKDLRTPRLTHARHSPKVCDLCNSVPWIPLLNVPDSYRQQRTHINELHKAQNFKFDYEGFASNAHNLLLPPTPLAPPLEPIYDGTISSSFGLPIGNIPTGHGMLAPINHLAAKVNRYGANSIDYSNSLKIFPTQSILESNPFPQLSPVPLVPIHDAPTFYSTITNLVPPTKTADVSNVVLTIAEDGPAKVNSNSGELHSVYGKDLNSESSSVVGFQSSHTQTKDYPFYPPYQYPIIQNQYQDFGRLEIIKSIPLAEWQTSSVNYSPSSQIFSAIPPVQAQFSGSNLPQYSGGNPSHQPDSRIPADSQKKVEKDSPNHSDFNFLVPPPTKKAEIDTSFNASKNGILPFLNPPKDFQFEESVKASTAPAPLTSPSLNWLFSDHQTQMTTPKVTEPAFKQFASDTQEIASIVNNELRPVPPYPFSSADSPKSDASKSKKIQIIIPYTTKNENSHDNNALESVHHEVYQTILPPVSTHKNNSSRDSATPALPTSMSRAHHHLPEANQDRKVIDGAPLVLESGKRIQEKEESHTEILFNAAGNKYLTEMQHIIASNLRELLREEIEKSQSDQNYPLQNNIDNWTALEYSNHKTVGAKEPKEIVTQALAVTSIPGTSISHLLLPSKKIPNEYFATTPLPVFDEPNTTVYNATNSTVDSRPFTAKPYATTNFYFPVKNIKEDVSQSDVTQVHDNHEKNYTEIDKGKVNNWGRLNENLVLPEARSRVRKVEATTVSASTNQFVSEKNDKVQIITPVSFPDPKRNYATFGYRRTTRQVHTTEKSTTPKLRVNHTTALLNKLNSTKLEKVSNLTSPFNRKPIFRVVNSTIQRQNHSRKILELSKTNVHSAKVLEGSLSEIKTLTFSNENLNSFQKTNTSEGFSINDVFPFRNQELPWEPKQNLSVPNSRSEKHRKSLIKQSNLQRPKAAAAANSS